MTDESNPIPDRGEADRADISAQIAAARQDDALRERLGRRHKEERELYERLATTAS